MILSAEALEIIAYLKTAPNKFVSILEISRRAGGKKRFEESPNWARDLMAPLIDAGLLEMNSRGHYRCPVNPEAAAKSQLEAVPASYTNWSTGARIVDGDYFPAGEQPRIVAGDYFPSKD